MLARILHMETEQLKAKPPVWTACVAALEDESRCHSLIVGEASTRPEKDPITEWQRFKHFQKRARKVGLLVNRRTYELYFRNHLVD
jgi:hypothetical protein